MFDVDADAVRVEAQEPRLAGAGRRRGPLKSTLNAGVPGGHVEEVVQRLVAPDVPLVGDACSCSPAVNCSAAMTVFIVW